jgi:asparagine synthase (glutamine-hydrolysing)
MMDAAANAGATVILTGQGGDDMLDMLPYHLADLIRRGHFMAAWREACAWARGRGSTPWRILQLCAFPDLTNSFRHSRFARLVLPRRRRALRNLGDWAVPDWIDAAFAKRYALADRAADADAQARRMAPSPRMAMVLQGIQRRVGNPVCAMLAAPRGIAMSHPFLDPRVISFAIGFQERFRPDPYQVKPILAEAMRGSLPEPIRTRRDKRSFNETYYLGLSRNAKGLKRMVESASDDGFGMLNKSVLISGIEEAALGIGDARGLYRFDTALAAIVWLANEREWRQRPINWRHSVHVPTARAAESAGAKQAK